jgi:hypothetical protein
MHKLVILKDKQCIRAYAVTGNLWDHLISSTYSLMKHKNIPFMNVSTSLVFQVPVLVLDTVISTVARDWRMESATRAA